MGETEYLILRKVKVSDADSAAFAGWVEVPGAQSIKAAVEKEGAGMYVQVPKRSWKPESYKLEPKLVRGNP